jgi:hypothetical protein
MKQHAAQDDRLQVAGAVAVDDPVPQERAPGARLAASSSTVASAVNTEQRLVAGVDPEDGQHVAADVGPHRPEQARLPQLVVGADGDVVDRGERLAGLDERLERVGELRHHVSPRAASRL